MGTIQLGRMSVGERAGGESQWQVGGELTYCTVGNEVHANQNKELFGSLDESVRSRSTGIRTLEAERYHRGRAGRRQ